jgi:hypothetical protein
MNLKRFSAWAAHTPAPSINPDRSGEAALPVQPTTAMTILNLAIAGPPRPVDELILRLRHPDGWEWFEQALLLTAQPSGQRIEALFKGELTLDAIVALKNQCKRLIGQSARISDALGPLALYCLAVATALVQHNQHISSQSREEWDALVIDLAEVAPLRWRSLLMQAAMQG